MISSALLLPFLAALAHAEDHLIVVGGPNTLAYNPPNITAMLGDTITFEFHEKNHSVVQAAFSSPCTPLVDAYGNKIGFNSGFNPVPPGTTQGLPTFSIMVNDTQPIWAYCAQTVPTSHCQAGMVFSANAPETGNTFDAFKAAAMATGGGASSSDSSSSTSVWTSPPPPVVETVTATVTVENSVYTTTYASWEGASPNPTPDAQPVVHTVIVGGTAGLVYTPPTVTAAVNDMIIFEFHAKNHTATRSNFNSPCTPNGDFDSGFMPVSANATVFPTYNITINDTAPVWVYCRQPGPPSHCSQGMVFAANPPTMGPNTFSAFLQLAEHTNVSTASASGSSNTTSSGSGGSGSGNSSNGASRAAFSAGLSVGVIGVIASTLL